MSIAPRKTIAELRADLLNEWPEEQHADPDEDGQPLCVTTMHIEKGELVIEDDVFDSSGS